MRLGKYILLLLLLISCSLFATNDSLQVKKEFNPIRNADTLAPELIDTSSYVMTKSTSTALLYSIIPGAGQFYVESYWKSAVFFGGFTALTSLIVYNNSLFFENKNTVEELLRVDNKRTLQTADSPGGEYSNLELYSPNSTQLFLARSRKEFYRDTRDRLGLFLIVLYGLSAVDAYVGAHLYDFNIKDNISANYDPLNQSINLTLKIKVM